MRLQWCGLMGWAGPVKNYEERSEIVIAGNLTYFYFLFFSLIFPPMGLEPTRVWLLRKSLKTRVGSKLISDFKRNEIRDQLNNLFRQAKSPPTIIGSFRSKWFGQNAKTPPKVPDPKYTWNCIHNPSFLQKDSSKMCSGKDKKPKIQLPHLLPFLQKYKAGRAIQPQN